MKQTKRLILISLLLLLLAGAFLLDPLARFALTLQLLLIEMMVP